MSLPSLFTAFSAHLHSPEFRELACHAGAANAFSRRRKLPLPSLVAVMLAGMRKSAQTELDEFFAHLEQQAQLVRHVSEQAFAKARVKLAGGAIAALNDWLQLRADEAECVPRRHGLRLVTADASRLRFARRASHVARAASAEQIAFGLYLPGADMMLAASLHAAHENERQMLFEHLDRLSSTDLLLLDREASPAAGWWPCSTGAASDFACASKKPATAASPACAISCARAGRRPS